MILYRESNQEGSETPWVSVEEILKPRGFKNMRKHVCEIPDEVTGNIKATHFRVAKVL